MPSMPLTKPNQRSRRQARGIRRSLSSLSSPAHCQSASGAVFLSPQLARARYSYDTKYHNKIIVLPTTNSLISMDHKLGACSLLRACLLRASWAVLLGLGPVLGASWALCLASSCCESLPASCWCWLGWLGSLACFLLC